MSEAPELDDMTQEGLAARGVRVKALEFEDGRADSLLGRFEVECSPHGVWFVHVPGRNTPAAMKSYKSEFAAIDALKADYEARILSALEDTGEPALIREAEARGMERACLAVSEKADWPEDEHGRTEQPELFARVINAIRAEAAALRKGE